MRRGSTSSGAKPWTLLVYLAGDNELGPEMVWCLQEMKQAARRASIRDAMNLFVELDAAGTSPRRYELSGPAAVPLRSDDGDLRALGRDAPRLAPAEIPVERFLADAIRDHRASARTAVILSGHGSGAVGDFLTDLEPKSALSIPVLGGILARTRARLRRKTKSDGALALLGLDSCQMSTVESAYEVREHARYLVASEGTVLSSGWPYHRVLAAFSRHQSEERVARAIVRGYLRFYRDYELAGQSTDIAACALSEMDGVATALGALVASMVEPVSRLLADGLEEGSELGALARGKMEPGIERAREIRDAILLGHWSAQSYKCERYVDLADFCAQLARRLRGRGGAEGARVAAGCETLERAVARAVLASGSTGAQFQHSRGLSIYFPWSIEDYDDAYENLAFARDTGWARFVASFLARTRRMRRGQELNLTSAGSLEPLPPLGSGRRDPARAGAANKDPDAGTHRDPDAGTHRGRDCAATMKNPTMKNPPRGYYGERDAPARGRSKT